MTVIVALNRKDGLVIGYANGMVLGGTPVAGALNPWIRFGNWVLGITGSSAVQSLLAYEMRDYDSDDVFALIGHFRKLFSEHYIGSKGDDDNVCSYGIYCILANRDGRVWDMTECLSLSEIPTDTLWAQGSGADYAVGADYAIRTLGSDLPDSDRVRLCVEAAINNDIHCVGNPVVERLFARDITAP